MGKFEQAGVIYGPDVVKPTVEELEKEGKGIKIKNRPDGNTIITTEEEPKQDRKESIDEILKKHDVDKI